MYREYGQVMQILIPAAYVLGGFIIGLIVEKIINKKMRKLRNIARNEKDDEVIKTTRGCVTLLFVAAGAYGAILSIPMEPSLSNTVNKSFLILAIIASTIILDRFAEAFINLYSGGVQGVLPTTSIFINITRMTIFIVGALTLLAFLGISITPVLTALGVGGLAVALALQDTLSNLFSGLQIIAVGQYKTGEYVKISLTGEEGYIEDINWRNTTIKTGTNNFIIIPNSKMATSIITNFSRPEKEIPIFVQVAVCFGCDLHKVEETTLDVAKQVLSEVPGAVPGYEPQLRYDLLAGSGIRFKVWMQAEEFGNQSVLVHEFIKKLDERYKKEGIKLMAIERNVCTVEIAK